MTYIQVLFWTLVIVVSEIAKWGVVAMIVKILGVKL